MSISLAAARIYATALFDIGVEGDSLDRISDELQAVRDAIAGLPADQRVFFELPQVRKEDKLQAIERAFGDQRQPARPGLAARARRQAARAAPRRDRRPSSTGSSTSTTDDCRPPSPRLTHSPPSSRTPSGPRSNAKRSGRSCSTRASTPA